MRPANERERQYRTELCAKRIRETAGSLKVRRGEFRGTTRVNRLVVPRPKTFTLKCEELGQASLALT